MKKGLEWFAPKSHGIGSGLPIAWQGWAVLIVYTAVILAALLGLEDQFAAVAVTLTATVLFVAVAAKTTKGGWRWRWGKDGE